MIFPFCTLNKSEYPEVSPKANGSPVDIGSEYRGKELETPLINGVISPIHDSPLLLHPLSNMKRSNNNLTGQTMHPDQHFMHNPDSNIHPRVRRHLNFGCNEGFILHEEYSEKSLILNGGKDFKDSIDMGGDDNKDNNREMIIEFSDTFHKEGIHYYSKGTAVVNIYIYIYIYCISFHHSITPYSIYIYIYYVDPEFTFIFVSG